MIGQSHFHSPRLLLADGRDEIHRLNMAVRDFLDRTAHFHAPRFDLEKRVYVHKVQFEEALPPYFAVSVRKIASPLRSALDHAVNASKASLGSAKLNAAFPFGDTPAEFERDVTRKCCGVAPGVISIVRDFKPHKGGNNDLWALNKLRNVKEHRLLVAPALAGGMRFLFKISGKKVFVLDTGRAIGACWDNLNKTLTFQTLPTFEHIEKQLVFFLTFGDVEGIAGEHLIPKLQAFAAAVENCIDRIEEGTGRLLRG
jgi:hypothetical protein